MPTIDFSQNFIQSQTTSVMGRMYNWEQNPNGSITAGLWTIPGSFSQTYSYCAIYIMKGTVPTDITTLTAFSQRSADVLVTWDLPFGGTNDLSPSNTTYYLNPSVITSIYVAAGASGTATWFWWLTRATSDTRPQDSPLYQQIIGTVGDTGSGNDLEISSTSVVSGQLYRINNLRLQLPRTYTY